MRKQVKNGFIEFAEAMVRGTAYNPSTHEQDPIMKKEWTFTPHMLPDDAAMPRSIEGWQEEFDRIGKKLPAYTTQKESEFEKIAAQCTIDIERAYKERYEPSESQSDKTLRQLGFK